MKCFIPDLVKPKENKCDSLKSFYIENIFLSVYFAEVSLKAPKAVTKVVLRELGVKIR